MITGKDLIDRGWPEGRVIGLGLSAARKLHGRGLGCEAVLETLEAVHGDPESSLGESETGELAQEWTRLTGSDPGDPERDSGEVLREHPLPYRVWGAENMEDATRQQIETALRLPVAVGGALMADAHLGYGLPVGGVLATKDAVIPWAVGVDIACRLRLSVFDLSPDLLGERKNELKRALEKNTVFGPGAGQGVADAAPAEHAVLDDDAWEDTAFLRSLKDTSRDQLGTSGSGNHFVEWGVFEVPEDLPPEKVAALEPLVAGGRYLALLSHSGSRGAGFKIAGRYSGIAEQMHPELEGDAARLAWLDLSSEAGEEYWRAMLLAGRYAAANHAVIHARLARTLAEEPAFSTEHHHNFAWLEKWRGEDVIVHRKGATPAGRNSLGIVPGTMADPGYVTLGRGNEDAVNSAAHGAGRTMSRTQAFKTLDEAAWRRTLQERGISLIGGALDEAPTAYKGISGVMASQADLVEVLGTFAPGIVRMDESKPRRRRRGGR